MAPVVDTTHGEPADELETAADSDSSDVPEMLAERVGELYAQEERAERTARTERLIEKAEHL
jgi:hypothetical protein